MSFPMGGIGGGGLVWISSRPLRSTDEPPKNTVRRFMALASKKEEALGLTDLAMISYTKYFDEGKADAR